MPAVGRGCARCRGCRGVSLSLSCGSPGDWRWASLNATLRIPAIRGDMTRWRRARPGSPAPRPGLACDPSRGYQRNAMCENRRAKPIGATIQRPRNCLLHVECAGDVVDVAMRYTRKQAAPRLAGFDRYEAAKPGTTINHLQIRYGEQNMFNMAAGW